MVIVTVPLTRVPFTDNPARVTEPVGGGLPLPPLTVIVTESVCAVVMLGGLGVTVTVGNSNCAIKPVVADVLEL